MNPLLPWTIKDFCFYILGIVQYENVIHDAVQGIVQMDFMSWSHHFFLFSVPIFLGVFDLYILLYFIPTDLFTNSNAKGLPPLKIFLFMFPDCPHSSSLTYMYIIYASQESPLFRALSPSFCCPS